MFYYEDKTEMTAEHTHRMEIASIKDAKNRKAFETLRLKCGDDWENDNKCYKAYGKALFLEAGMERCYCESEYSGAENPIHKMLVKIESKRK